MLIKPNPNLLNACRAALGLPPILTFQGLTDAQLSSIFAATRNAAHAYILANGSQLPPVAYTEIHPYPIFYPFNPGYCFSIVGTFPPVSYEYDVLGLTQLSLPNGSLLQPSKSSFYHGNEDSLWTLFNIPLGPNRIANRQTIINWLRGRRINYFDVISECQRIQYDGSLYSAADECLTNILIDYTAIERWVNHKCENPVLWFNTSSTFGRSAPSITKKSVYKSVRKAFDLFVNGALELGYQVSVRLGNNRWYCYNTIPDRQWLKTNMRTKVIFYLKINDKVATCITGPSPSSNGLRTLKSHPIFLNRFPLVPHPNYPNTPTGFRKFIYDNALSGNHAVLWQLNQ